MKVNPNKVIELFNKYKKSDQPIEFINSHLKLLVGLGVLALFFSISNAVYAGDGGSEFDSAWISIVDFSQSTLGKIVAVSSVFGGFIAGIVRQSLMAFIIGASAGLLFYNSTTIVEIVYSATLEKAPAVIPEAIQSLHSML